MALKHLELLVDIFRPVCNVLDIYDALDTSALSRLARTCRTLQPVAESRLYHSFVSSPDKHYIDTPLSFFLTLADCPRVAAHVRDIVVVLDPTEYDATAPLIIIRRGLAALTAPLTRLFFIVEPPPRTFASWTTVSQILCDCTVPISELWLNTAIDRDLLQFLKRQDTLRNITLEPPPRTQSHLPDPPMEDIHASQPGVLSNLRKFCGPMVLAPLLLGHPTVTHCSYRVHVAFERGTALPSYNTTRRLHTTLSSLHFGLRSLYLPGVDLHENLTLDILRNTSLRLPCLRYLGRLILPLGDKLGEFFQLLNRMSELRFLELTLRDGNQYLTHAPEAALRHLVLSCATYCPSLRTITIKLQTYPTYVYRFDKGTAEGDDAFANMSVHSIAKGHFEPDLWWDV
ncbi:hypothetical protein EXIGLDRAFT_829549 [Exidia glandulosa HHB12029]|uniref:F-box domain-containing protein n=1 Tax=Exidia glandulosa HHB12029 TaxID=1314781 RepID=A0A165PCI8_EXIGL|nr:hypothetical protein EXIGLDRAFT_829549 [Exidia glandulosa HHB12029]